VAEAAGLAQAGGPLLWLGAIAAGLGGGAFYPLVASLVREFFGVERVGEIHAVVYSAKAVAGVAAVALALLSLTAPATALLLAAALAALPALATLRLRAPGRPVTLPV
jgi:MFS family permease